MPDTTDPGQSPSVPSEPVKSEPVKSEPVKSEPVKSGSVNSEDGKTRSVVSGSGRSTEGPRRRAFLRGALGAGTAGAVAGVAAGYAYRATRPAAASQQALEKAQAGLLPPVPFHGRYQAGILPPSQRQTAVISFNATADGRAELTDLFRTITERARFLTAGGTPPPSGIGAPPSDSGVLGPTVAPDGLTVTVGVGSTLFDDRYGLAPLRPAKLTPMRAFPDDNLDPAQCGGDLVLQLSAGNADAVVYALRDIARHTRGGMQALWRIDGYTSPARPSGTIPRNMLGFMDGIANPDTSSRAQMDRLVWVQPGTAGEPAWTAGGSYFVIRLIRMLVEFWDRVDITEQENMIGRRRAFGYPLDANSIGATPNYTADPTGAVIPLTSHIRLANPRTAETADSRILRRGYNYDRGIDQVGNLDIGLIFTCFQQDIRRQFETVQTRLAGEPLTDYISPFGGGYFLALPGVVNGSDYLGRVMLA
jgi:deferrochelatase/peroxidase EfeB